MNGHKEAPQPLYLDHAASTAPAPEVIDAMLPWLRELHANPHSEHLHGQRAHAAVEEARDQVSRLIGAQSDEIVFTSGATESNNLAIQGFLAGASSDARLITTGIEHKSVGMVAQVLRSTVQLEIVPVVRSGVIAQLELERALTASMQSGRRLLALSHANNELGTIQPITAIAELAHEFGWKVHVDAAQSVGKIGVDVEALGTDSMSLSSHKLYGPAGIGALYVADDMRSLLSPIMHGGGQEGGLRPGSIPVFLAVGFGKAAVIANRSMDESRVRLIRAADAFIAVLRQRGIEYELLGDHVNRLPGHLSLRFVNVDAADLLQRIAPFLSASLGSACTAGQIGASHVLRGVGLDDAEAAQVIRVCFGRSSTIEEAASAGELIAGAVARQTVI